MATIKLLVLSLVCLCVYGFPNQLDLLYRNATIRNTIFADERYEGEIFEMLDVFSNTDVTPSNVAISPYRLPTTTRPHHYNVLWHIRFPEREQSGTVAIELYATQPDVSEIVIHSRYLTLQPAVLTLNGNVIPTRQTEDEALHFLRINLIEGTLNFNAEARVIYVLTIDFAAPLRKDMYGIYESWFRDDPLDTQVKWMASTQFQATAARFAFPCYDEPSFKATFDVTIRRPSANYESWFCTRRRSTGASVIPGYDDDVYHTTPIMSTYLLALIVADYGHLREPDNFDTYTHEVIARRGAIDAGQGVFAMETGQALLAEMDDHTNYPFATQHPQLKMTQAAIPDFGAGAMENWGLLTYREAYLMYDEFNTNKNFKQIIAYILSHEIAHMWFGNLVTCDWWDVLWLNEGFARYYQYYLTDEVTDMGFDTRFITEQVHTALLSDSSNNPQPLTNPGVGSPSSVSNMFSTISYNKGAAVIRMTEHLLGSEVHRAGLRTYLRDKEFDTALPIDLFTHLEQAGIDNNALDYGPEFSFIDYYKSWTEQGGHPVLNVYVNHQTGEMTLYQRRFNINTGYSNINSNYIIPITFTTASNPDFDNVKPTHIINKAVKVINRGSIGEEWVIFNKQQTGFYRVNYDDYTWNLIVMALRNEATRTTIHEYNRAQIINDAFQFARSGLMSYTRAFNIISFLENETNYAPWLAAVTGFNWLRNRLASLTTVSELTQLNSLILRWSRRVMDSLGYVPIDNEPFLSAYLRLQLAPIVCALGDSDCREAARIQFSGLMNTPPAEVTPVAVDNRNWVYCNGVRQGDETHFNTLWRMFQASNVYTEKILILQNIGCTSDAPSLHTLFNYIVLENYEIRRQDYTSVFNNAVSGNEENTLIAFEYIKSHMEDVSKAFGDSLVTPLSYVSARLRSEEAITEFEDWVRENQEDLGDDYYRIMNGAQSTRESLRWTETIREDITFYLSESGVEDFTTSTSTTPAATEFVTTQQPSLAQPTTPDLPSPPDSAATTFISIAVIVLAFMANIIL